MSNTRPTRSRAPQAYDGWAGLPDRRSQGTTKGLSVGHQVRASGGALILYLGGNGFFLVHSERIGRLPVGQRLEETCGGGRDESGVY